MYISASRYIQSKKVFAYIPPLIHNSLVNKLFLQSLIDALIYSCVSINNFASSQKDSLETNLTLLSRVDFDMLPSPSI